MRRSPLLFRPPSSAIDATRFTPTSPHAFSKPAARSSRPSASTFFPSHTPQRPPPSLSSRPSPLKPSPNPNLNTAPTSSPTTLSSGPAANGAIGGGGGAEGGAAKTETPAEKVARLRAARAAARSQVQIGTWDRIVVTGRVWSDRIHRFTAVGLIGLTGNPPITLPAAPIPSHPTYPSHHTPFPPPNPKQNTSTPQKP